MNLMLVLMLWQTPDPYTLMVAPHVWAIPDTVKGQTAWDACVRNNGTNASFVCESQRQKAMVEDAAARFNVLIKYLTSGHTSGNVTKAWNTAKMKYK